MPRRSYHTSSRREPPFSLVLDPSSLVPCGDKPEEEKVAIRRAGELISETNVAIYLSRRMLKVYRTRVIPLLREHHPLPPLQAGLTRTIDYLWRTRLCRPIRRKIGGAQFHILERTRVERYDVRGLGLEDEEDMEVLRVALAIGHDTLLVTIDRHFLEGLRWRELRARYPTESNRLEIIKPSELIKRLAPS